jgi:hypothetical protein
VGEGGSVYRKRKNENDKKDEEELLRSTNDKKSMQNG